MAMGLRLITIFSLVFFHIVAAAKEGDVLRMAVSGLTSSKGQFIQITDGGNKTTKKMSGNFMFLAPGRFIWHYLKPYEQLLQSDGNKLYIYDVDLAQVSVQPFQAEYGELAETPAGLIFLGLPALEKNFILKDLPRNNSDLHWVEARPKKTGQFNRIVVGIKNNIIMSMELEDTFQQTTILQFANVERNPPLAASLFVFKPPKGVDVVTQPDKN